MLVCYDGAELFPHILFSSNRKNTGDQKTTLKKKHWFLVANELITRKQAEKEGFTPEFISKHFEIVQIPKNKVYWFFGARFESKN